MENPKSNAIGKAESTSNAFYSSETMTRDMASNDFSLTVDGEDVDVRSLMSHFQKDPYPGGQTYQLTIRDTDVISAARKEFGLGTDREPDTSKQISFLSYLFPMIGMTCGRSNLRYWANTIDEVQVSETALFLKGVCSLLRLGTKIEGKCSDFLQDP